MSSTLNVWMNGEHVAAWAVDRGSHSLTYTDSWLESERVRSLSLSLPITSSREIRGVNVANYFDNLLPDNPQIRQRLSARFGTRSTKAFDLLTAIGRDCVGAVQLLPEEATPVGWNRIDSTKMSNEEIADLLRSIPSPALGDSDDELFRISVAGAQEKTALLQLNGKWMAPHGATPTTHILKLPLGLIGGSRRVDAFDSVQNEWLCAQIVRALGLPVANTSMARFHDQHVLVVERFDREWMAGGKWIARLPQEDFCQALGFSPDQKYERDGGPGMESCLRLVSGSEDGATDLTVFLLAQFAYWLMAATDGHAKNYSIFLNRGDRYGMTPLYDVLSMWPYFGNTSNRFRMQSAGLAMAIRSKNAHYKLASIQARHWHSLAMKHGGGASWHAMLELKEHVGSALDKVERALPKDFPVRTWQTISDGMRFQVNRFNSELSTID